MAYQLKCPCGVMIVAIDDEFVDRVNAHLAAAHPGRTYSDAEIMMLAMWLPDRAVPDRSTQQTPGKA